MESSSSGFISNPLQHVITDKVRLISGPVQFFDATQDFLKEHEQYNYY